MTPTPSITVIIPAFNEEGYLRETIDALRAAERLLQERAGAAVELVVVDNDSTDRTAAIAHECGATVVGEAHHNVARVRNTGARAARHDVLVFLDADTLVPAEVFVRISSAMADPVCAGGSIDIAHRPTGMVLRVYFGFWRIIGLLAGMAQGACQFCRRDVFAALGGYDETIYMGEDVDFFWRLRRFARRSRRTTCFIGDLQVVPSVRRFDQWSVWRTLLLTNPLVILLLGRRRKAPWAGWYDDPPR